MFIVIETFDKSFPVIVTDENGYPLLFDFQTEAQGEADLCQDGIVIEYN